MADKPQDPFEMLRRLWAPLGVPVPGLAMPTLDPDEVAKHIADLKAVESWLNLNLNMVKMAVHGLEMQKAALDAMRPGGTGSGTAAGAAGVAADNPMMWPWAMMQSLAPDPAAAAEALKAASAKAAKQKK
jgi:hypothetical protein